MRRADPHRALIRALALRYPALTIVSGTTEPWASVTFTGARHMLTCAGGTDLSALSDAEFDLPGHLVADIVVTEAGGGIVIEALTIETA